MKPRRPTGSGDAQLRQLAERQLAPVAGTGETEGREMERLVHELQVHQIELELQNEELRSARDEADALLTQFTELYDFAPVGYLSVNEAGVVTQANRAIGQLLQIERSPLIGRRFGLLLQEADRVAFSDFLRGIFTGTPQKPMELSLEGDTGTSHWCRLEATLPPGAAECHITATDLTERRAAETGLLQAEQFARDALDALSANIAIIDGSGTIIRVNQGWTDFAIANGATPQNVGIGRNYFDVSMAKTDVSRLSAEGLVAGINAVLSDDLPEYQFEYPCHSPDEERWFSVRATRFTDHGAPCAIVAHQDITARIQLQTQLLHAQKMEIVGQLAGGIAHDFNNLLTVINGVAELALTATEPGTPLERDLVDIASAGQRAARLTRQLLAFSRKQVMSFETVAVDEVVLNLRSLLQRLVGDDITLEIECDAETGSALVDANQLEQVVMNLVINAHDAMPDGGILSIRTGKLVLDDSRESARWQLPPGPYLSIRISDTGTGMTAAVRERIFEPFFTTKEIGRGTGLGLSTVQGIVAQSQGSISVESTLGVGTDFCILLPRVEPMAPTKTMPPVGLESGGRGTILIVEDESAVRRIAERVLLRDGYAVLSAASGESALEMLALHSGAVDLMLTDMRMPGMSGAELAAEARARFPALRVVFASGNSANSLDTEFSSPAPEFFLGKPYLSAQLLHVVRAALLSPPR